jgi:hypothetical protein
MSPERSVLLACMSASLLWASSLSVAHAEEPQRSYATTKIEIDASALEGSGSTMERSIARLSRNEVQEALTRELSKQVMVVEKGAEATVYVELEWKDYETSHYELRIAIRRGASSRMIVVDECKLCDEGKLAAKVVAKVPGLLPFLAEDTGEPVAVTEPEAEPKTELEPEPSVGSEPTDEEPVVPADDGSLEDEAKARPIGALGISGAVVGAGGLAGIIYGSVLLSRGTTTKIDASDPRFVLEESFARPGAIWLGVGVGTAVVGAAMVAVDLTVLRKRRTSRVTFHPAMGPAFTGATMRTRF